MANVDGQRRFRYEALYHYMQSDRRKQSEPFRRKIEQGYEVTPNNTNLYYRYDKLSIHSTAERVNLKWSLRETFVFTTNLYVYV